MSTLASLKSTLRTSNHTAKVLLGTATTPIQNQAQELIHSEYIERIHNLIFKAYASLLEIEAVHRSDIDAKDLATFRTSLTSIEHNTSTAYTALYGWKALTTTQSEPDTIVSLPGTHQDITRGQSWDPDTTPFTTRQASRHQQNTSGKPSTQLQTLDTVHTIIWLPETHLDATSNQQQNQDTAFPITRPMPDTTMSSPSQLKSRLCDKIYAT